MIIILFCSPKNQAYDSTMTYDSYDSRGTELDIFDTQDTLEGGRLE